jgi:hypothetical protein
MTTHGTKSAYNRGCRCDACREASRLARSRQRQTAREHAKATRPEIADTESREEDVETQTPKPAESSTLNSRRSLASERDNSTVWDYARVTGP